MFRLVVTGHGFLGDNGESSWFGESAAGFSSSSWKMLNGEELVYDPDSDHYEGDCSLL